jgi:hypothetical protein
MMSQIPLLVSALCRVKCVTGNGKSVQKFSHQNRRAATVQPRGVIALLLNNSSGNVSAARSPASFTSLPSVAGFSG